MTTQVLCDTVCSRIRTDEPKGHEQEARFSNMVHWGYGTSWGVARCLISASGLNGPRAAGTHFLAVWGSEQVMLPALGVAPPFWKWGVKEVSIDAFHHLVYAGATSVVYALLDH